MALYSHLIADNGRGETGASVEKHLASVFKTAGHLARVRQMTNWNDKEFVVTPKAQKFTMACAWGVEANRTTQGGSDVKADTDWLITRVKTLLDAARWNDGQKAIFSYFNREDDIGYYKSGGSILNTRSGHGMSCVAYKFDLRHLHFSKMTSFSCAVRFYQPTLLFCNTIYNAFGAYYQYATIPKGSGSGSGTEPQNPSTLHCGASKLHVKLLRELPEFSTGIESAETVEFTSKTANNKTNYWKDNEITTCTSYDPYNNTIGTSKSPLRVYLSNNAIASRSTQKRYTEFQMTSTANKDVLKTNPGELWVIVKPHSGNAISSGDTYEGLAPHFCANIYAQRIELVFRCTGTSFNQYDN